MPIEQDTTSPDQTQPSKSRVEDSRSRKHQMYKKDDIVRGTHLEFDYDSQSMQPRQVSFTICEHLGTGGMGAVYKVKNHRGYRALKLMNPEDMTVAETLQRFKNETKAAISIKHRNVVRIFLQGETEQGQPFMLMEYVEGLTLGAVIAARRTRENTALKPPLAIPEALEIFEQLAAGLSAAHREQIIHRDIKPANIMLTVPEQHPSDGNIYRFHDVKIVDFGIAKLIPKQDSSTRMDTTTGAIFGTPMYMSPEQCEDTKLVDYRSDIYSLGCVMYEALTGKNPFFGENFVESLSRQLHTTPPALQDLEVLKEEDRALVMTINDIVMKMLNKNPAARYQSMTEVLEAIKSAPEIAAKQVSVVLEVKNKYKKSSKSIDIKLGGAKKIVFGMAFGLIILICVVYMSATPYVTAYITADEPPLPERSVESKRLIDPMTQIDTGKLQEVIDRYQQAVENKLFTPEQPNEIRVFAEQFMRKGDYAHALELLNESEFAIANLSGYGSLIHQLVEIDESTCFIAQKKYDAAAKRCSSVIEQSDHFVLKSKALKCSALLVLAEAKLHLGKLAESTTLFNQAGELVMQNALGKNPVAEAEALSSLGCFYLSLALRPKSTSDISRQEARDRANSFLSRAVTAWLQISQSIKYNARVGERASEGEKRLPRTTYEASIFNLAAMQNNLGVLALSKSQRQKALEFLKDAASSINNIDGCQDLRAKILYNQSDCFWNFFEVYKLRQNAKKLLKV